MFYFHLALTLSFAVTSAYWVASLLRALERRCQMATTLAFTIMSVAGFATELAALLR